MYLSCLILRVTGLRCNGASFCARTSCGRLLLGAAASANYAARCPRCGAAAELSALCAEISAWFAAARGVASGVCATCAMLLQDIPAI